MRFIKQCVMLALFSALFPPISHSHAAIESEQEKTVTPPLVQHITLANGLQVLIIPNHKVPVITSALVYKIGGVDDPLGKSGLAHLLEHFMFRETKHHKDVTSDIESINGVFNAYTSEHITVYHHKFTKEHLKDVLELESDRMHNLVISAAAESAEKRIVLEERHYRLSSPASLLEQEMAAIFYMNNKGWNVIGLEDEISSLTKEDAIEVYNNFYNPGNAILILAGDLEMSDSLPIIKKSFEAIPNKIKGMPRRILLKEPETIATVHVDYCDPKVERSQLIMLFPFNHSLFGFQSTIEEIKIPRDVSSELKNIAVLQSIGNFLGGGSTFGHLEKKLIFEKRVADSISIDTRESHFRSLVAISALPKPGISLKELEEHINKELQQIILDGITEAQLTRVKRHANYTLASAIEDPSEVQEFYARYIGLGFTDQETSQLWSSHEKVSTKDFDIAFKEIFSAKPVIGYLKKEDR